LRRGRVLVRPVRMILEVAILDIKPGQTAEFERDFAAASVHISSIEGYISHELQRCIENPHRFLLLARWKSVEAHTVGFRESPQYLEWKRMLHHYYDPFPTVQHYTVVYPVPALE
jgi:heme-degrading monooxygenase HmoA